MLPNIQEHIKEAIAESLKESFKLPKNLPPIELEIPNDKKHGEFACNIAMRLAKPLKKAPLDIAAEIVKSLKDIVMDSNLGNQIKDMTCVKPGFINFYIHVDALYEILTQTFKEGNQYGAAQAKDKQKIQIEFVSANPTGPLSVAHARQAAVGDALGNILRFIGHDVTKEYYVNDRGNQINLLGESVKFRAQEILSGESRDDAFTDDHYRGDYLKDIAKQFLESRKIKKIEDLEKEKDVSKYSSNCLLDVIKHDLDDFNVKFDVWTSESKIANEEAIQGVLDFLGEKGFMYEKDGALWFKSTDFGDDKDRVVEKSDGTHTYLTPDIVYHRNKFDRGFKKLINIWGPDHHGYIPRIKAAAEALGYDRDDVEVLIVQLATIYRDGKPLSMSTRKGEFISLREVIDEVGTDAARFFFMMRRLNQHLDFDLDLAKKETSENPAYYIQYAYARIHSIHAKAKEANLQAQYTDFREMKSEEEIDLIKKIGQFPLTLLICYNQLDPYALGNYLHELAADFHRFYEKHKVVDPGNENLSAERLGLIDAASIVFNDGLKLLGLSTPKKM